MHQWKNRFSNQFGFRDSKNIYRFKFQIKWKKRKKNVNGNAFHSTWKYTDDLKRIAVYGELPNGYMCWYFHIFYPQ